MGVQCRVPLPLSVTSLGLRYRQITACKPSYQEFIFGGLVTYRNNIPVGLPSQFAFSFGLLYRYQDAIIPTVKVDFKNLSVGFSYDVSNSSLATQVGGTGATELTVYVRGKYNHKKDARDPIMCPRFEDDANPNNSFR